MGEETEAGQCLAETSWRGKHKQTVSDSSAGSEGGGRGEVNHVLIREGHCKTGTHLLLKIVYVLVFSLMHEYINIVYKQYVVSPDILLISILAAPF